MVEVSSADVAEMSDSSVADFIADINDKQAQLPLGPTLGLISGAVGIGAIAAADGPTSILSTLGAIILLSVLPLWGIGAWIDQSHRRSVLFYNLNKEESAKSSASPPHSTSLANATASGTSSPAALSVI